MSHNVSDHNGYQSRGSKRKATRIPVKEESNRKKKIKTSSPLITVAKKTMGEAKSRRSRFQKKKHSMSIQPTPMKVIIKQSRIPRRKKWRRRGVNTGRRLNHPVGDSRQTCTGKLIALAASLAFIRFYETTPLSHTKGNSVKSYSKFSKTASQNISQRILRAYYLTYLAHNENTTDNFTLTSVHLHFKSLFYLYLTSNKVYVPPSLSSKKFQKQTQMSFQSRVHPTPSLPPSESNNLAHQINFFTPYEDVNLANLFTNVQITEDDRIFVPSDPSATISYHLVLSLTLKQTTFSTPLYTIMSLTNLKKNCF